MRDDFKPVLKILLRFVIIYLALLFLYQLFLNSQKGDLDLFSKIVGNQCTAIQNYIGYPTKFVDQPQEQTSWFNVNGKFISRMVEGCNAISIMILFLAFVFAFYKGTKTFVFAIIGLIFIHIMNVLRIVGLNWIILNYPQYSKIGHEYFFPAIIYGSIVLLWLIWINFFALKK